MDRDAGLQFEIKDGQREPPTETKAEGGKNDDMISWALVLLPALIGTALAAFLFPKETSVIGALSENAAGYAAVFAGTNGVKNAFLQAVVLSRADITVFFLSLLFPYTAASRPLTALTSALRTWLTALAVVSSIASPIAAASLTVGLVPTYFMLRHADAMHRRIKERGAYRPYIRDLSRSVTKASVLSGAVIAARALLLLLSMAITA